MALTNHYLNRNETVKTQKDNMSLYINGEWFGFLKDQFNPSFSVAWEDSGYANIIKGIGGLAKGGIVSAIGAVDPRAGAIASQGADMIGKGLDIAREGARLNGYVSGQSGLMKKKLFSSPNFWDYTADVQIVDMEGTGLVNDLFQKLKTLALPSVTGGDNVGEAVATGVDVLTKEFADFDTSALSGAISRSIVKAPAPVHIRIGNYANTEGASSLVSMKMVINDFTPVFSVEQTEKGPIRMDLTISLSSVEPMVADAIPIRGGRVSISNGESNTNNESQSVLDNVPKPNF